MKIIRFYLHRFEAFLCFWVVLNLQGNLLLLGLSNVWLLIALLFLLYALGLGFVPSKLSGHLFCRQGKAQNCWALSNVFCFCWYMNYFFPFSDWGVCVTRFYTRLVCFGFILFNSLFVHMKWLAEFVFTFHLFRVPRLIYEECFFRVLVMWHLVNHIFSSKLLFQILSRSCLVLCFCNLIRKLQVSQLLFH